MERKDLSLANVVQLLRTSNLLTKHLSCDVEQHGLSMTEFAVLELLYHKGLQATQNIAKQILIASSSTTYVIDQLVKKSYVYRKQNQADKRVTDIDLTDQGKLLMDQIFPKHAAMIVETFDHLSKEELITLNKLLSKVRSQLTTIKE